MMSIDLTEYKNISTILFWSFFINIVGVLGINIYVINNLLICNLGMVLTQAIQQFFFGALGTTIACSVFMSKDKDTNELESVKSNPDPKELRMPDSIDKRLYIHRIISSGLLAILGMFILLLAFNYLEVSNANDFTFKQKLLVGVFSFLIGLHQSKFLTNLEKYFDGFLKKQTKK